MKDYIDDMRLSIERMIRNNFIGLMWVSEAELYSSPNNANYATVDDYEQLVGEFSYRYNLHIPITFDRQGQ